MDNNTVDRIFDGISSRAAAPSPGAQSPNRQTSGTSSPERGPEILTIAGKITRDSYEARRAEIIGFLDRQAERPCAIDLSALEFIDSAGALLLIETETIAADRSLPLQITGTPEHIRAMLALIDRETLCMAPLLLASRPLGMVEQIGVSTMASMRDAIGIVTFAGELIVNVAYALFHPSSVRWRDVLVNMKKIGVDGLPITALISVLLGLIIAFLTARQLKPFGANIYVAPLVAFGMVRELGPMMTAIIVAGRSGSAFAAEIGSMKINEEIDALTTMGFNPVIFLAVPKLLAAVIVVPLLTLFAILFAIGGGLIVGVTDLDLTVRTYIQQSVDAVSLFTFSMSYLKSVVFAALIAAIGCHRGFQVQSGAEAVGNAATSALVTSLFLIILFDSIFAVMFRDLQMPW